MSLMLLRLVWVHVKKMRKNCVDSKKKIKFAPENINKPSYTMRRILFLTAMMLTCTLTVMAQLTTSALSGKVTMQDTKEEVIGATIQVVHDPSGTKYNAVTNVDGGFSIQGMRSGGPYTVTVTYIGYEPKTFKEIYLDLGETYNLPVWLSEDATELKEIVVSGKASKFSAEKTGASTNIRNTTIQELPTISRSIGDIAKLSPYYGGSNSFAGGNGKSANFTLDGANLNNNFGLSSDLPGGGSPVSMEALDEVQLVVAPFDVRQTNFIGGGVNAVTKSGTNTFKGTAYYYYSDENMHGNRVDGKQNSEPDPQSSKTYGFTLGGPIIKDKLFFFTSYERIETENVPTYWKPSTDGKGDSKTYTSNASYKDLQTISDFVKKEYGYDTGSSSSYPGDILTNKYLARLDWNINKAHRLALRFNHTNNSKWIKPSTSRSGFYSSTTIPSITGIAYANSFYKIENKVTTISADLNSRFSDKASNQFIFTYSDMDDPRGSDSAEFPFIDIMKDGSPYIALGMEQYTYGNRVRNKVLTINDNFTYYMGKHKLMAGLSFEHQQADNSYLIFGTGYYRYASMDDFLNKKAPMGVALTYGFDGESVPTSTVRFNQYGLYFQDEWNPIDNLKITAGIRFDNISYNDADVRFNQALYDLDFGGRHFDVGRWPKANIQISPRFGFTWDVFGDKTVKVRGGSGLFAGRLPLVFFVNTPQYSGMIQNQIYSTDAGLMSTFAGGVITDVDAIRQKFEDYKAGSAPYSQNANGVIPGTPASVADDFKMPQVWKSSIAVDYQLPLPFPITITGELTYTKNVNAVRLDNWNIKDPSEWTYKDGTVGAKCYSGADNRYIYPETKAGYMYYPEYNGGKFGAYMLTNTSKGYGWTASVQLTAEPIKDLHISAAYTHTVMKEVTGMPGSNAASAWSYMHTINGPNYGDAVNSAYVTPDRVIANLSYKYGKEHFSVFYSGYSPSGWSYIYSNDLNGDTQTADLIYIPKDDSEIQFVSEEDRIAFWNFVEQDDYLKNHKGEYAEPYAARSPWVHTFDVKYAHDFDVKVGKTKHKLQLILNIQNVGNLLNSKWGVNRIPALSGQSNNQYKLLTKAKVVNNQPVYSFAKEGGDYLKNSWDYSHSYGQCWGIQLGLKYYFN